MKKKDNNEFQIQDTINQPLILIFNKDRSHQNAFKFSSSSMASNRDLPLLMENIFDKLEKAKNNNLKLSFFHKNQQKNYGIDPNTFIEQIKITPEYKKYKERQELQIKNWKELFEEKNE